MKRGARRVSRVEIVSLDPRKLGRSVNATHNSGEPDGRRNSTKPCQLPSVTQTQVRVGSRRSPGSAAGDSCVTSSSLFGRRQVKAISMPTGPVDLKYREFLTNIDENDGLKLQGDARNWIGNRIGDALSGAAVQWFVASFDDLSSPNLGGLTK